MRCFPNKTIAFVLLLLIPQEGSGHEDGEDADGEDEDFDLEGDETSDESDSEELEEKGRTREMVMGDD